MLRARQSRGLGRGRSQSVAVGACLGLSLLLSGFLDGCRTPAIPEIQARKDEGVPLSSALDIDIYLDGSGSMKHFLGMGPDGASGRKNAFRTVLDRAESVLRNAPATNDPMLGEVAPNAWSNLRVRSWRFGGREGVAPLPDRDGLSRASSDPGVFNAGTTVIETAVNDDPSRRDRRPADDDAPPRPELKVIVTDLYQSDGELDKPADALADRYLNDDTDAVAVLAVRNPFDGAVEDLPGSHGQVLPGAARSMPFYVIVAGHAADVRHAVEVLVEGTGLGDALAGGKALAFFFSRAPRNHLQADPKFSGGSFSKVADQYKGQQVPLVGLRSGALSFRWSDPRDTAARVADHPGIVPNVPFHTADALTATALRLDGRQEVPDDAASAAASPCADGAPGLCLRVDRARLQTGSTYVFQIARSQTLRDPFAVAPDAPVLQGWNIEPQDAEAVSRNRSFPGGVGETPGLSKFLNALQGRTYSSRVHVATYYLYVQAR